MILQFGRGEVMHVLQEEVTDLRRQLAALSAQVAALSGQLSVEIGRSAQAASAAILMRERLDAFEAAAALRESRVDTLADEAGNLDERLMRQEEATKQGRGAIARVEKQAAVDLDEIRRLNTALVGTLLRDQGRRDQRLDV